MVDTLDLLQLQCKLIADSIVYNCGNESYCFQELSIEEKKKTIVITINGWRNICRSIWN